MNAILSPSIVLVLLLSIGYASLYHLWGGRGIGDLLVYLVSAIVGFTIGQLIGQITQAPLLQVGEVHVFEGTIGAWLALVLVHEYRKEHVGTPT